MKNNLINLKEEDIKDLDNICDECKKKDESVFQYLILSTNIFRIILEDKTLYALKI